MTTTERDRSPAKEKGSPEHVSGGRDIWFFVLFESLVFTSYFCVYLFTRTQHEQAFLLGQSHLLLWLGVLDTIVLLTSSWAVARCVHHFRAGQFAPARREAFVTAGLGMVFLILKIVEWVRLIHMGDTFTSSQFFQYYFFLTAIHCVHLLVGLVVLGVLVYQLSGEERRSPVTVETCAVYWHSVDFFWVLIFALLYVVR
jgi:nitric oxide reductase NorE protein